MRTERPPSYSSYRRYKPFLRQEFARQCVYCRALDTWHQSDASFGVDHYRPKTLFPSLTTAFENLFYCCNRCNTFKGPYWPRREAEATEFIPNPCDHEMFQHLRYRDCEVEAKTRAGEVAIDVMDLNDADAIDWRQAIDTLTQAARSQRDKCRAMAAHLRKRFVQAKGDGQSQLACDLAAIEDMIEKHNRALEKFGAA